MNRKREGKLRWTAPVFAAGLALLLIAPNAAAQDFGFDEGGGTEETGGAPFAVNIGGEIGLTLLSYVEDLSNGFDHVWRPGSVHGRLNFSAGGSIGEAVINFRLNPAGFITQLQGERDSVYHGFSNIVSLDEAYARAWFGDFEIEAGMRKLVWGKADSMGPLDVINPLDYSELTSLDDLMNIKIANTLIHGSYRFGQSSKIEAVFVPVFEPWHFATKGRWAPAQMKEMMSGLESAVKGLVTNTATAQQQYADEQLASRMSGIDVSSLSSDTTTLDYAQAGLRFTTTIGSADVGVQYYYGWLPQPAIDMAAFAASVPTVGYGLATATNTTGVDTALAGLALPKIVYNSYHQIGVDWAQVLFGFNVRAELAANLTSDLKGDDGAVYNPSLAWSLGFDHDLVWGINLNFQASEAIKLLYSKIDRSAGSIDTEAGTDMTSTRLTAALSKKFLRDELELRTAALWGIEDGDFLIMPAIIWTRDAVSVSLSGGIFGGSKEGQLGQYRENSFLKVGMKYLF
jgi:hypothetical protein